MKFTFFLSLIENNLRKRKSRLKSNKRKKLVIKFKEKKQKMLKKNASVHSLQYHSLYAYAAYTHCKCRKKKVKLKFITNCMSITRKKFKYIRQIKINLFNLMPRIKVINNQHTYIIVID